MNTRSIWKYAVVGSGVTVLAGVSVYKILKWYKTRGKCAADYNQTLICSSWAEWQACESKFLHAVKRSKILGLDCEWVTINDERQPVALLQLAPSGEICFLIRLCCMLPEGVPETLLKVLEDASILKVGVNVVEDAQKLFADFGWNVKGCLDLRNIIKNNPEYKDIWNRGLRALAGRVLKVNISKSVEISCSDWEAETLNMDQVKYATEDATVAVQIFEKLCPNENQKPLLCLFGSSAYPLKQELREFIDVPYKGVTNNCSDSEGKTSAVIRPLGESRTAKLLARAMKNPHFDNCFLVAPDGEPLCACDKGKANWYLEKGRGELVCEDPFIVRLKFEPSGRPILDNKYYIQEKKSGCVVCGNNDHIFKKTVVPREYRRYFPLLMKKNLSHDVVLLCVTCHRLSNVLDCDLRNQLAKECDAPVGSGDGQKQREDSELARVKSAAKALLQARHKMPPEIQQMKMEIIREHFGVDEVTEEQLMEAASMKTFIPNENYVRHGLKVYQHMCKNGGLIALESRWRKHFIDTMQPKFLPHMWSIDHNHERLALQVSRKKVDFDISILGISQEMFEKVKNL